MRIVLVLALAACGSGAKKPTTPEEPPRDLGPEQIGPVPAETRHVETDAYSVDVEAPNSATIKEKVSATVVVRAKQGLIVAMGDPWTLETKVPQDMDVATPVIDRQGATLLQNSVTYNVTVVPLRAGVRHITFKLAGSVCDADFCDVVGDLMSWNLEVK